MDDKDRMDGGSGEEMDSSSRNSEDSGQGNPATLGIQGLSSIGQDASECQELPSGMSAGTSTRSSVPSFVSSSQDLNIDQLDATKSSSSSAGAAGVGEQCEVQEPHFPDTVPGGEQSTSSGATARVGAIAADTPYEISERAGKAHQLLLPVLKEILKHFNDERFCDEYRSLSDDFFTSPSFKKEVSLCRKLRRYLERRRILFKQEYPSLACIFACRTREAFEILIRIVLLSLMSTLLVRSSLKDGKIKSNYESLRTVDKRFKDFWEKYNDEKLSEEYKTPFWNFLSLTDKAFREILEYSDSDSPPASGQSNASLG